MEYSVVLIEEISLKLTSRSVQVKQKWSKISLKSVTIITHLFRSEIKNELTIICTLITHTLTKVRVRWAFRIF
jgi:hypothetical protein